MSRYGASSDLERHARRRAAPLAPDRARVVSLEREVDGARVATPSVWA